MPLRQLFAASAVLAFSLLFAPAAAAQKMPPARAMATTGDTVWVIVNSVKPDKRAQYERFVNELFWPLAAKMSATDQRTFRQTRVLNAYRPEADGTYSYMFIMDPMLHGQSYDILSLLEKGYGKAKAAEYHKLFTESLARPQKQYAVVQSRF